MPSLDRQIKIVKILFDIENKIYTNNQINNNLHELIKSIYSEYLNQLDNYEELDIKEIFDFETGVEPGSKNYTDVKNEGYVKFYRVGDMNSRCNTYVDLDLTKNKLLNTDDIVVSFDATVGRIGYGLEGAYSTGMKKISISNGYKNELDNSIVYAYFNDKTIQDIIKQNARGTTILHASSSIDFMKFKYNKDKIKPFNDVIKVLFNKMKNNKKQNETLEQLRDTLLPKLMNGKIDLDNIEI